MSTKLLLLKSGEQVLAEAKELVRKEGDYRLIDKVYGYLLTQPHKVSANKPVVLTENVDEERNVEITLSPWILLSDDKVMTIPKEWVITIVNPIDSVVKMYQDKING